MTARSDEETETKANQPPPRPPVTLLVGQSGGPTPAINASLVGVVQEGLASPGVGRVLGMLGGIEGVLQGALADLGAEGAGTLELVRRTPGAALGSGRYKLREVDFEPLLEALRRLNVRYFHYIGGNDSADTAHRLAEMAAHAGYELQVVSVPKTIDNDLPVTDHCPGYGSAARYVALAAREAGLDTWCMRRTDPVKFLEVMGRHSGWLAASSALAREREGDPPHLVYFPEDLLDVERVIGDVERCYQAHGYVLAVVCETQRGLDGAMLGFEEREAITDSFGHRYGAMPARYLAMRVQAALGLRARFDRPGSLQCSSAATISETDLDEAYRAGRFAVQSALAGATDRVVVLTRESDAPYRCGLALAPLTDIANAERPLPDDFIAPTRNDVTPAFLHYARPLIGPPLPPYGRLALHAVTSDEYRVTSIE